MFTISFGFTVSQPLKSWGKFHWGLGAFFRETFRVEGVDFTNSDGREFFFFFLRLVPTYVESDSLSFMCELVRLKFKSVPSPSNVKIFAPLPSERYFLLPPPI